MEARYDVAVCGSLHLDILVDAPHLPRLDETAVGQSWRQACGGKGGNQAAQAARLGARVAMIGRVGGDAFGQQLCAHLDAAGVDRRGVTIDAAAGSGMSVAIVDADGNYGAVIVSGANLAIDPDAAAALWHQLGGSRIVLLQNEVPMVVNLAMARAARQAGAVIVLNAAPARDGEAELDGLVDVLVVNRVEAEMLTGATIRDRHGARAALPSLGADRRTVIITLGGAGLVMAAPGRDPVEIDALPVAVISTHGAGDCFVGALASRLAAGDAALEACHFANRAAADFVSMIAS